MAIRFRSLTGRVLSIATLWVSVALVVIAVVVTQLYRNGTERGFADLLRAQLYNVINSVSIDEQGELTGTPELGDLRFSQPRSGWYWAVDPLGDFSAEPIASISLGSGTVPIADIEEVPFSARYERLYEAVDSFGQPVLVAETEVLLDAEGRAARFRVIGNRDAVESDIGAFSRQVILVFLIFGLGSLLVNAAAILYGLRPLDAVRRSLERIRAGESGALEGPFPREIEPLAGEVNALIESNRRIVERARMQVGNLAHSLKTPIAVLLNEARDLPKGSSALVKTQAETMQTQVQTYLDRARIAAQSATVLARTQAAPALERLLRVMRRLHPHLTFSLDMEGHEGSAIALEQQDFEEIAGNLLDNAAKFARSNVRITVHPATRPPQTAPETIGRRGWLTLVIEDDGVGLDEDQIAEAMKRGRRLDESKPGTGLGLSIVSEIAGEYHGTVALTRSELGGLRAAVILPAVASL